MTSTSVHEARKCSNCSKTASRTCKACKTMPSAMDGQLSSTWYCGPECQKADWIEHKPKCKASQARQALYRAAVTAQKIFYTYQNTLMWAPEKFEKNGTTWLMLPNVHTSTSQLVPFPYEKFPNVHDQEALLTYQSCNTALSEMHNVVKTFLVGLYSKIEEVDHSVKNAKHELKRVYLNAGAPILDGTDYNHDIIKITTRTGEIYALDMTGAQYGWTECIVPWSHYVKSRVREVKNVVPFGETKVWCLKRAKETGGQYKTVHDIKVLFAQVVDCAVMFWQRANILTTDLFRLPEQEFQKKQASLLDAVEELLQKEKAFQESQGTFESKGGFSNGFEKKFHTFVASGPS